MNKYFLTDTQRDFQETVRRFADQRIAPQAARIDETDEFPAALFEEMARLGLLGAPYPPEYGGGGADAVMVALLLEEVSRASGAVGS
ncbi:MAG TPA: acyl-CoA dehydrogenase family protein, partial [Methylomirabilota bacterium]|nr:acyl-CoA dehydrogenase family protein [Methylomirabilota bacterium]